MKRTETDSIVTSLVELQQMIRVLEFLMTGFVDNGAQLGADGINGLGHILSRFDKELTHNIHELMDN